MRLFLRFIPLLFVILTCCSKSDDPAPVDPTESYIRFKIDGVSKEFKESAFSSFKYDDDDKDYFGELYANLADNDDKDVLGIFIYDNEDAKIGKEYNLQNNTVKALPQLTIVYFDSDGTSFTAQFETTPIIDRGDQAKLVFTEITNKNMKGNFTATVVDGVYPGPYTLRTIIDGEFMLNRID